MRIVLPAAQMSPVTSMSTGNWLWPAAAGPRQGNDWVGRFSAEQVEAQARPALKATGL